MYWTDWEEDPTESNRGKIKKAWMDGSHHQVFLTSKTVLWPNGLSLDIPQGILYWVDAYYDRIELVYLNTTERKVGNAREYSDDSVYIFTGDEPRSLSRFNRWCMRGRSLTTPLDYAITSNFSFGMNTGAAASTNWTRSPRRSRSSATRGRLSLRSECMMHTSSKVYLPSLHSFSLHDMLMSRI